MIHATSLDTLLAAQIAAEDAVLAQGLEVWSVADPDAGEVVLHMTPNDLLPRGGMQDASGSNPDALTGTVGSSPTGAANADGTKLTRVHDLAQALRRVAGGSMDWIWDAILGGAQRPVPTAYRIGDAPSGGGISGVVQIGP